jgi:glycosyltransferase involved in cell wall biosynthesis
MKLLIQIPCRNEAGTLPITLAALPRQVVGFDAVEWLVIDDGSRDGTGAVARQCGVDHVVSLPKGKGLAAAFMAGIDACLKRGADVIVNTDADNQYDARDIPALVGPILAGRADMVVGERPIGSIRHFSGLKKLLQALGSFGVRIASNTTVADAPSGFRAISKETALRLNVFSRYTYTLETLIQAGRKNLSVLSVPIRVNPELRPSRLVKNVFSYVRRSIGTIVRISVVYRPFRFFFALGSLLSAGGVALGVRYMVLLVTDRGEGHIQSLILASILLGIGFQVILVAFLADLMSVNRGLLEDIQYRLRKMECQAIHDGAQERTNTGGVDDPGASVR